MKFLTSFVFFILPLLCFSQTEGKPENNSVPPDSEVFTTVEEMPQFIGGEESLFKFIISHLVYPPAAIENNVEGKIYLKFVVFKDGSVGDVKVISKTRLGFGCEEEAIRIVKMMPKWKPGKQNGKPVAVYFVLPFQFKLN